VCVCVSVMFFSYLYELSEALVAGRCCHIIWTAFLRKEQLDIGRSKEVCWRQKCNCSWEM